MPYENSLAHRTNELRAIQRLISRTRTLVYQGLPAADTGKILDDTQSLLSLLLDDSQPEPSLTAAEFRQYLHEIETRSPSFDGITAGYDASSDVILVGIAIGKK